MKYELNISYNGVGVVYLLQRELYYSTRQYEVKDIPRAGQTKFHPETIIVFPSLNKTHTD